MKKYIILIPIYNDKESLIKLIENINLEVKDLNSQISIIVVNDASSQQVIDNCQNISLPNHNKSGHIGVSWFELRKTWTVYVKVNKKNKWLGYYKNLDDAIAARKAGEKQYYNLPEEVV